MHVVARMDAVRSDPAADPSSEVAGAIEHLDFSTATGGIGVLNDVNVGAAVVVEVAHGVVDVGAAVPAIRRSPAAEPGGEVGRPVQNLHFGVAAGGVEVHDFIDVG